MKKELPHPPIKKIYIIYKRSVYQKYILDEKNRKLSNLIRKGHTSTKLLLSTHHKNLQAIELVKEHLKFHGIKYKVSSRTDLSSFKGYDLVLTVGGDGTFLRTAQHLRPGQMILGVNSVPSVSTGALCAIRIEDFPARIADVASGNYKIKILSRIAIKINGKKMPIEPINDVLFTNHSPAATSRYILAAHGIREEHKSSGLWISTARGSTAAIHAAGGVVQHPSDFRLQLLTREPYQGIYNPYKLTRCFIEPNDKVKIVSKMIKSSLYLDGPTTRYDLAYGDNVTIQTAKGFVETIVF